MTTYCWRCNHCGNIAETNQRYDAPECKSCGKAMKRDYRSERVANTFHPTIDQYAKKKGTA
jgi:predicted nucleic acid-binding Zn ribbon protein